MLCATQVAVRRVHELDPISTSKDLRQSGFFRSSAHLFICSSVRIFSSVLIGKESPTISLLFSVLPASNHPEPGGSTGTNTLWLGRLTAHWLHILNMKQPIVPWSLVHLKVKPPAVTNETLGP
ncbi:hypothetical protein BofuT4_P144670.1 [Botrytis cinerea T4]|uniref:Uncharacterized protein n=1 Tax=Botryotinia fuckeliana (strain T4) TaxID=999810 RepID=G2YYG1_BOTF4|nr:hypothetical protein BofuT4_P144670.1 [Botrytis cinerea T4]